MANTRNRDLLKENAYDLSERELRTLAALHVMQCSIFEVGIDEPDSLGHLRMIGEQYAFCGEDLEARQSLSDGGWWMGSAHCDACHELAIALDIPRFHDMGTLGNRSYKLSYDKNYGGP